MVSTARLRPVPVLALLLAFLAIAPAARAAGPGDGLTVVASDATGITLRFAVPAYRLVPVDRPEGRFFHVDAPGLGGSTEREGRPLFPAAGGLIAIPADAEPVLRVVDESLAPVDVPDGREPEPVGKSDFRPDGQTLEPVRTFWRDPDFYSGSTSWPFLTAELGTPGGWRHQRVVPVRLLPFRWDPAARQLRVLQAAVVRIDFVRRGRGAGGALGTAAAPGAGARLVAGPRRDPGFEGAYEKALLNYEAGRDFRIAPAPPVRAERALGAAVGPEWRLRVDSTGVWRVTYAQLAARGFPPGVATSALTLSRRDWAGDVTPPFVRVEVPIRIVEGAAGSAGTFDGDDAIVFYGQSWTERARPSEFRARFTDAEYLYLGALVGGAGARMNEVSADLALASPARPTSFPSFRRYQRRFYYNPIPRDTCSAYLTWTEPFQDANWTDTLTTFTPDPDPAGQVRFGAAFQGVATSPGQHTIWMRWKRPSDGLITPVFTESFFSKDAFAAETTFAASRIAAGTNRLEWRGYTLDFNFPDGGPSGASLRWYDVTYDRLYRAFANGLDLNTGAAEGDVEIEVDGFTAGSAPAVQVYDVTDSTAPVALLVPPSFVRSTATGVWAAKFQAQVTPGVRRRYVAAIAPPQLPDAAIAALTQENATALWDPPGAPDYVLIAPEEFLAPARRLADHRRSEGFDVLVAPMNEVADAYDGGRRTEWAVRRFLADAFTRWGTRFALLFGDASEDPRNLLADSDRDFVPTRLISGIVGTGELSASDFWLVSDLDGSTPPPPPCINNEPDLFADMALGRLPVGTLAQANGLVDRLVAYDTQDREGAWRGRVLLVPDDPYSYGSFFGEVQSQYCYKPEEEVFENISHTLEDVIRNEGGFKDLNVDWFSLREQLLPLGRPVPGDPSICFPVNSTQYEAMQTYAATTMAPAFRTSLNQGALVVNFQGHGSAVVLAHEALFRSFGSAQDIDLVFNEGKPFFFLSFSCHVNQFTDRREKRFGDCLGENMVLGPQNPPRPTAGALASYASSNFELLPSDYSGRNHLNVWLFRALFVDPPNDALLGERGARVLLGEALDAGAARAVGQLFFSGERRAVQTYLLLGDPATPLNTGAPRLYATANDDPVVTGTRYQPTAFGDSVVFVTDLVDESRIDDIQLSVAGEGARAVDPSEYVFSPDYPDTANGGGGRRYRLTWTVRPQAKDAELVVSSRDRSGLASSFRLPLVLEARLFAGGQLIGDGDPAPSAGPYQFIVSSPAQLSPDDLVLTVDGAAVPGAYALPANADTTRRLWAVSWEGAYPTGDHVATLAFPGGATRSVSFNTSSVPRVALRQVFAFPTPFAGPPVTFNFTLDSDGPADVLIKVYSVSGSLVYQRIERSLTPGYHQLVWDGNDSRGDALANGAYTYQVIATDDRGLHALEHGRLAKVR